jgi:hypothetical protein
MKLLRLCVAPLMLLASGHSFAQVREVEVTGRFRPSALNPGNTEFENTTPRGGFCNWRPGECDKKGAYIFDVGGGEFWRKSGDGDNASRRDTTYVHFPKPRLITLTEETSGRSFSARVSFVAIALQLHFSNGGDPWYHGISGGCTAIRGVGGVGWSRGGWAVTNPADPAECFSTLSRNSRTYAYRNVGLGIHVELPRATTLQNGRYVASESWSTGGAEADIDLGDNITGTSSIRMNFVFDVIHEFEVRFSSESPTARLTPDGGWSQWVDHGLAPGRLFQELPFSLTSSMDFSMKLRCEHDAGERCGIKDAVSNKMVPVDVDVTIPGMGNSRDGRPAQNTALLPDDGRAPRFTPDGYLMQRRSTLRFTAGREAVTEMLKSPGSHWQGNMTVVFDANP